MRTVATASTGWGCGRAAAVDHIGLFACPVVPLQDDGVDRVIRTLDAFNRPIDKFAGGDFAPCDEVGLSRCVEPLCVVSDVPHLALLALGVGGPCKRGTSIAESTDTVGRVRYPGSMALLNARNLRKAKELIEKNRHKVGDAVGKATEKIDKASGGKTTNFSKKAEDAARKYSAGSSATHHGDHP